jgi:hypothetical protein
MQLNYFKIYSNEHFNKSTMSELRRFNMMRLIMPREAKVCSIICAVLFLLAINIPIAQAQFGITRTHDLGKFKLLHFANEGFSTNTDDATDGTGQWPQDVFWSGNFTFQDHQRYVGSWVDDTGALQTKTTHGGSSFDGQDGFVMTEYRRYAPPNVTVFADGALQQDSRRYQGEIDPNLSSDIMVENRFKCAPGFHAVRRSYSFSNPNHDDYVIYETTYRFTGDHDDDPELEVDVDVGLTDVYFIIGYCMMNAAGTWINYSRWYEEGKDEWTSWENYPSVRVPGGRDLAISYSWDGNYLDITEFEPGNPGPTGEFDDTGEPRWAIGSGGSVSMPSGELISSAYSGFAVLHADEGVGNSADDVSQPLSIVSNVDIYNLWDDDFPGFPTLFDWAAAGSRAPIEDTPGWPDDPNVVEGDYPFQSIGPYNFALNDSITIVHVLGTNGISRDLSIEKGLEWRAWYRGETGADFDNDAKNTLLATGKDSLFQSFDNALWAWSRGLNVPDPLPAPDLAVTSGPSRIDLSWKDMSEVGDLDTGVPDLDHYRVYRKKGSFLVDTDNELREDGTHLRWELIATVPATETTYRDEDVIRGESYHYGVTAVDDGTQNTTGIYPGQKLESSMFKNRSVIAAKAFEPGAENTDGVLIVPNPFISGAGDYNFSGARSNVILFVNLPPFCILSIYTVTGDLIKTINHTTGSADNEWDLITESNQFVASGVYLLRISEARNLEGGKLPDTIEKFVVVR